MDISEAESGSMKFSFDNIPVKKLLEDTIDLYEHVAEDKGLRVNLDCRESLIVKGDRKPHRQALANLLDNAIDIIRTLAARFFWKLSNPITKL